MESSTKRRRGDIHPETGLVFWARGRKSHHIDKWVSLDVFLLRKEKALAHQAERRSKNPGCDARWARENRIKNQEKVRAKGRENYHKNKAAFSEYRTQRRLKNLPLALAAERASRKSTPKEVLSAKYKKWANKNLDKLATRNNLRVAKQRKNLHPLHDERVELVLRSQAKRLSEKLGVKFHVDHIIPVAKGGPHYHLNLMVMPATWNLRKNDGPIDVVPSCWHPANPQKQLQIK